MYEGVCLGRVDAALCCLWMGSCCLCMPHESIVFWCMLCDSSVACVDQTSTAVGRKTDVRYNAGDVGRAHDTLPNFYILHIAVPTFEGA